MFNLRTLFVAASLVLVVAGLSAACTVESAFISGKFNEAGQFEVASALDSKGNALEFANGKVFANVVSSGDVVLPASSSDELIYLVADLDFDNDALRVASYTHCAQTAQAKVAQASVKPASGSGCCAFKAASATNASAEVASAPKAASTKNASSCGSGAWASSAGSGCSSAKSASTASYANAGSSCFAAKSASAADGVSMIVFNVSGMTCGGCASKIQAAVAALEMEGVESVEVDVEKGQAVVKTSGKVCTKTLKTTITEAGFPAEIVDADLESKDEEAKS